MSAQDAGVTLITGASSGIGRSLARRLALAGDRVALLARRADLLEELAKEIEGAGGVALAVPCDVTDPAAVRAAVAEVEARLGPVETLIANAGGSDPTFMDEFSAHQVESVVRLNLLAVASCIEAVLPGMLERGHGHLVATGSLAAYRGLPSAAAYGAAKAGLANLMESLRIDLRPRGIDVTLLAPGFVRTKPGARKRKRNKPLRMDLEAATERMARSIRDRRGYDAFPRLLVAVLSLSRLLPHRYYDRLVAGRGRSRKKDAGPASS